MLGNGGGVVRLGTKMELLENLYSLLFVSLIRQEYIEDCEDKYAAEQKEKEEGGFTSIRSEKSLI